MAWWHDKLLGVKESPASIRQLAMILFPWALGHGIRTSTVLGAERCPSLKVVRRSLVLLMG